MRLAGVIFQYIMTLYPEHPLDFEALDHELALAYQRVWNLLTWCLYFQCCMNVALGISLLCGPVRFSELIGLLLGGLRAKRVHLRLGGGGADHHVPHAPHPQLSGRRSSMAQCLN